jgi:agmatinase
MNTVPFNFGGLEKNLSDYDNASIAVLAIPFDETSTWGKGADKGPEAIIEASRNMELYDIETNSEVYKKGIFTAKPVKSKKSEKMIAEARDAVKKFLGDNKFVVTLGGEHSISQGPIQAYAEKFPGLSILHLDAHSDRRDSYEGSKFSHACIMARTAEIVDNVVSVGIRSLDASELPSLKKNKIFFAEDIVGKNDWIQNVVNELSGQVYITIDLDIFDPSALPSTGTPEPGGLDWYTVLKLMKAVAGAKEIVGLDVVELAPNPAEKSSDFLAAKLIYKILSYKFAK